MEKKLGCWQGKMMDIGSRVILLNSCLTSIIFYMLSFYRLPVGVRKKCDFYRGRLLWQEEQGIRKYHLVNWETVCTPKDLGGLGVLNLELMNISLLCKWLWKLENEEGLWQSVLKNKYLQNGSLAHMEAKPGCSQFWSGLMQVNNIFYKYCDRVLVSGNKTSFWKDAWYQHKPLCERFNRLYDLSFNKDITVDKVVRSFGSCLVFRRTLWGELAWEWFNLLGIIHNVVLREGSDKVTWKLSDKGFYSQIFV
jgi:hypothetical protein